jgi:hypothetical protein
VYAAYEYSQSQPKHSHQESRVEKIRDCKSEYSQYQKYILRSFKIVADDWAAEKHIQRTNRRKPAKGADEQISENNRYGK